MAGIVEMFFGTKPKTETKQAFDVQDVLKTFQLLQGQTGGLLDQLTRGAFKQSSAFGPGFQGGITSGVAQAQQGGLLHLLNQAFNIEKGSRFIESTPGTGGIIKELGTLIGGAVGGPGGAQLGSGLGGTIQSGSGRGSGIPGSTIHGF